LDPELDITALLQRAHAGEASAQDQVARAFQGDLLRRARRLMGGRPGARGRPITLEPADLVNETFLKLLEQRQRFENREHFFAIATRVMLRVLMDYHKARGRQKRFGGQLRLTLSALGPRGADPPRLEVPQLSLALDALGRLDPRALRVVELRALWGMTAEETAEILGLSKATVDRDWRFARAWLVTKLQGGDPPARP
jgi:RNA polymerase sigma factor (TIGR02999 family)